MTVAELTGTEISALRAKSLSFLSLVMLKYKTKPLTGLVKDAPLKEMDVPCLPMMARAFLSRALSAVNLMLALNALRYPQHL